MLTTDAPPRRNVEALLGGGGFMFCLAHLIHHGEPYGWGDLLLAAVGMVCLNVAIGKGAVDMLTALSQMLQVWRGTTPIERRTGEIATPSSLHPL